MEWIDGGFVCGDCVKREWRFQGEGRWFGRGGVERLGVGIARRLQFRSDTRIKTQKQGLTPYDPARMNTFSGFGPSAASRTGPRHTAAKKMRKSFIVGRNTQFRLARTRPVQVHGTSLVSAVANSALTIPSSSAFASASSLLQKSFSATSRMRLSRFFALYPSGK